MSGTIGESQDDRTDNLAPDLVRDSPFMPTREQRRDLDRRIEERGELEHSSDPDLTPARTFARAQHRGLRVNTPDAAGETRRGPFEAAEHTREIWPSDLPPYVDWKTFVYANGPGRGFAHWLGNLVRPCADVLPVLAPNPGKNEWRGPGFAPLLAECARPAPPTDRAGLRHELEERLRRHRATRAGKPLQEMNVAFARDIHDTDSVDAAWALGRDDYSMFVQGTGAKLVDLQAGSRGGRRYAENGREHLSCLGAWPWCLTPDGELPPNWHLQQDYAEALARWHYPQWLAAFLARRDLETALSGSLEAVARHPTVSHARPESQAIGAALTAYRELYERLP